MGLFKWLPKTDRCCCCIRNLKCASFIIVILGMLTSAGTAQNLCTPYCKELYNVSSPINLPVNILRWILFTLEIILITSAFAFLLGIFWLYKYPKLLYNTGSLWHTQAFAYHKNQSIRVTADIFIAAILLKCFVTIVFTVLIFIQELYTNCGWYNSQLFSSILYTIMWAHFIIVINSYEEHM